MSKKKEIELATQLLKELGIYYKLDSEGQDNTPTRFVKALREMTSMKEEHKKITSFRTENPYDINVSFKYSSLCAHHLLPFFGTCTIHVKNTHGRMLGLSKYARIVKNASARPTTQEELTRSIANEIRFHIPNCDVTVVLSDSVHTCALVRGVETEISTDTIVNLKFNDNE